MNFEFRIDLTGELFRLRQDRFSGLFDPFVHPTRVDVRSAETVRREVESVDDVESQFALGGDFRGLAERCGRSVRTLDSDNNTVMFA